MEPKLIAAITTALIASITTIILAFFNYRLSRRSDKSAKKTEVRTQSYIDFINCVSEIAIATKQGKKRVPLLTHKLIDAKTRIAIYGDKKVIRQLAVFDRKFGLLDTEEAIDSFVSLISEMREDSIGKRNYDISVEIKQIIFGEKPLLMKERGRE